MRLRGRAAHLPPVPPRHRAGDLSQPEVRGLYGLALPTLDLRRWTVVATGWPEVRVEHAIVDEPQPRRGLHRRTGSFPLTGGGRIALGREPLCITFRAPRKVTPDEVVHPSLSVAAAGLSYWLGRDPFHAGAFIGSGGAWMVAGRSGAGKSTMVAALAEAGAGVLSDDLVVAEGGRVFAGPRAVDLRPESVEGLRVAGRALPARRGTRKRLPLPEGPVEVPLVGWIDLAWGSSVSLRPLDAAERLQRLARRRTFPAKLPTGTTLLDLVELPGWVLRRPRRFDALPVAVSRVMELARIR